ncbi:hypothetical protein DL89DRAFT_5308 [Linderina pennispora]|uniref:Uncharacterized protein n=1 Tax=Linderina pennispora TaxID=61395 RepID=A0A1Y1WK60_9FUNG|nr:uncharacterized protein DL89DRAFT_5308 [Linderina pennispora]ORX73873.1 hypothetical protein DL89DRAFT_5308 [Linderina pennispora]
MDTEEPQQHEKQRPLTPDSPLPQLPSAHVSSRTSPHHRHHRRRSESNEQRGSTVGTAVSPGTGLRTGTMVINRGTEERVGTARHTVVLRAGSKTVSNRDQTVVKIRARIPGNTAQSLPRPDNGLAGHQWQRRRRALVRLDDCSIARRRLGHWRVQKEGKGASATSSQGWRGSGRLHLLCQ